jgi:hypothetical protein
MAPPALATATSAHRANATSQQGIGPVSAWSAQYSQVTVDPQKSIDYVQRNRNKKVIYRSFVTNSCNDSH